MKTLVVYYTRTGNTKFIAETIAGELGADLEEVIDLKKRKGILGFLKAGRDAMLGKETEIAQKKNPAEYDLIIIGQPIWAGSPTPAIRTYLKKNDLSGKKVALFFPNLDVSQAIAKTKALIPKSTFVGEFFLPTKELKNKNMVKKKIAEWCNTLKMA